MDSGGWYSGVKREPKREVKRAAMKFVVVVVFFKPTARARVGEELAPSIFFFFFSYRVAVMVVQLQKSRQTASASLSRWVLLAVGLRGRARGSESRSEDCESEDEASEKMLSREDRRDPARSSPAIDTAGQANLEPAVIVEVVGDDVVVVVAAAGRQSSRSSPTFDGRRSSSSITASLGLWLGLGLEFGMRGIDRALNKRLAGWRGGDLAVAAAIFQGSPRFLGVLISAVQCSSSAVAVAVADDDIVTSAVGETRHHWRINKKRSVLQNIGGRGKNGRRDNTNYRLRQSPSPADEKFEIRLTCTLIILITISILLILVGANY